MKVLKRYNQHRRDLHIDLECENCGFKKTVKNAYDDSNYWENVVPNMVCESCTKTTKKLNIDVTDIGTKYPEGMQV